MRWGTNGMGDAWVIIGGPIRWGLMSWGTNETGNQWDGGPMRWGTIGIGRWWGDEWKGGPMRWGTSDMGDQWDGGPMRRGPMRWGTNEMGDQWADPAWGISISVILETLRPRSPFCRQYYQINFFVWKLFYFDSNFAEIWLHWINNNPVLTKIIACNQTDEKPVWTNAIMTRTLGLDQLILTNNLNQSFPVYIQW